MISGLQVKFSIDGFRPVERMQNEICYQGGCVDGGAFVLPTVRKKGVFIPSFNCVGKIGFRSMASDWVSGRKVRFSTKVGASMAGRWYFLQGKRRGYRFLHVSVRFPISSD